MKKIILSLIIIITTMSANAQNPSTNAYETLKSQMETIKKASEIGDFRKGVQMCTKILDFVDNGDVTGIPEHIISQLKSNSYYNMACFYSRADMKPAAINAFKNALDNGFKDYSVAKKDKDLSNIRHEDDFVELMKQLKDSSEK